ncbi:MAG: hypothetical protein V4662_08510 [Verrucomicrobiota bacterium]
MKTFPRLALLLIAIVLPAGMLCSQSSKKGETINIVGPGLSLVRFPLHPSQATADKGTGYVHYKSFGKPLRAAKTVYSLAKWEKPVEENAIVIGYIKIDKEGTYNFRTDSDWDRNELIIDDKIVCAFRDGANKGQSVQLRSGLLEIVSVGYTISTTDTRVQWMPPGQTTWTEIPKELFSRGKVEFDK